MLAMWKCIIVQLFVLTSSALSSGELMDCLDNLGTVVDDVRRYVDPIFNSDSFQLVLTCWEMALQFLAEGAAGGLNVIAVYMAEILRVFGVDPMYIPHFTPEGLALVVQWALLAGTSYWLLCILLRIGLALFRQVFWIVKVVVILWIFIRIITDPYTSGEATAVRLFWLVLISAVWKVIIRENSGSGEACLQKRLMDLEGRVGAMENSKED